jgi:hypothetical protein
MNEPTTPDYGALGPLSYVQTLADTASRTWDRFWFTPRDPVVLGLIRILAGLMLVYTHAVWSLALGDFLGESPWIALGPLQETYGGWWASYWPWVPSGAVVAVHSAGLAVLVLFTLGIWTRVTSILAWLITVSYANRLFFATFGLDQINAMLAFYLAISPCGDALSFDQWRRGRATGTSRSTGSRSIGANIGIRLIQVHMCVVYLYAGLAKLEGLAWWEGYAMWQAFANYEYQTFDMTWLAAHDWIWNAMTHSVVAWEISFCALIWFPLLRPLVLGMAILTHVGIGLCLGMWTFGLVMLIGCSAFLSATLVRRMLGLPWGAAARC